MFTEPALVGHDTVDVKQKFNNDYEQYFPELFMY